MCINTKTFTVDHTLVLNVFIYIDIVHVNHAYGHTRVLTRVNDRSYTYFNTNTHVRVLTHLRGVHNVRDCTDVRYKFYPTVLTRTIVC